jgi:DtxR family Mn-dependent transcriptional regulator
MPDPLISLLIAAFIAAVGLVFLWPDRGLYWCWQRTRHMTERVLIEDALKHIHKSEMHGRWPTVQSIAGALQVTDNQVADLLSKMEARDLLRTENGHFRLTPQGRNYALQVIRAHRLWERYLAEHTGFAVDEWHERAHRQEHRLSPEELDALCARLNNPTHDPHGDPIPTADGKLVPHSGRPLTTLAVDQPARVVHLADEPPAVYAQLVAQGLHPGMEVRMLESSPQRVRFWADGHEHVLAPVVAANVAILPLPEPQETAELLPTERLSDLKPGEKAWVAGFSPSCRGTERRRFLDLGILPGTEVEAEMISPSGDPTAYRIRGAIIALRREQANHIYISRERVIHQKMEAV